MKFEIAILLKIRVECDSNVHADCNDELKIGYGIEILYERFRD